MATRHAYKSEKRRKETTRLKKQEEKRQRRFGAKSQGEGDTDLAEMEGAATDQPAGEAEEGTENKDEETREGT